MKNFGALFGVWFSLTFSSVGLVIRFFGWTGAFFFALFVAGGVWLLDKAMHSSFFSRPLPRSLKIGLIILTGLLFAVAFQILYPIAEKGAAVGSMRGGSDRDDDLNVAVRLLMNGHYPYFAKTYLGNPVISFPGAILLAAPFVLLGTSGIQNFLWLILWAGLLQTQFKNFKRSYVFFIGVLAVCPEILREFVTGGSLLSNSLYVFLAAAGFYHVFSAPDKRAAVWKFLACIFLGITLSSRPNFLFLTPVFFLWLRRRQGIAHTLKWASVSLLAGSAVTLPFYFYDHAFFSRFGYINRCQVWNLVWPYASIYLPWIFFVLSILIAYVFVERKDEFFIACALTQVVPVLTVVAKVAAQQPINCWGLFGYGLMFSFFVFYAYVQRLKATFE